MLYRIVNFILVVSLFMSCGSGSSGEVYDLRGFVTEDIGGNATFAHYKDQNNFPLSSGHVINGVRTGTWTTYQDNSNKIKTITNYINGKKNGTAITFNERGMIEAVTGYRNDVLHGLSVTYKNGRTLEEKTYAEGKMDGPFAVYDDSNGKIQRRGSFKNGVQDGELLFYDQQGKVTLRYEYKDGKKISGGIVEQ